MHQPCGRYGGPPSRVVCADDKYPHGNAVRSMAKVTILSEKTGFHHVQYRKDAYFCRIEFFIEL
jgi:hypothetical protein